ncbi:MAG: tRNA (guanine-N(1)-)-methyltransferase, tRNA (guanine37-N1)-methyltransferase [Candidatus Gottesmanbacteria bacterium GW2011_GWA2_43_14]|uniref:tRNA (guanine-N(1)-)-methyltransferase n=1 Tax=Candidatus Gottesmanbacteria bacterium GW2011_GWA2_43_14 TaxID=1618443 RepID=A0A0G1GHX9_9BACT|nr:MAG: tRNA (guanine-N(1)-)-methyltransferase, tRNA (guanine37-N1)-methyltransferase [Candidatus Gottesmanbacteria bacterium GW2011_GWA2_43_14]
MLITILTLFPEILKPYLSSSIIGKAQKKEQVAVKLVNIRDYAKDSHKTVDNRPYGGGAGMLLRVDIVHKAIIDNRLSQSGGKASPNEKIILTDPAGKIYNQAKARRFSRLDHLMIVAGHYEGIDERIKSFTDETVSIGRFILTGGELPSLAIADSVIRLIPGVLKKAEAVRDESYSKKGLTESPQFTRPREYLGLKVPEVLTRGNHSELDDWKKSHRK